MTEKQSEIYKDIIERRGPENPLTKSQRRHLKKVAKRREKSEKRRKEHEEHRRTSKKVIRENRGLEDYTPEFTQETSKRYLSDLLNSPDVEKHVKFFKKRYLELLLKWSGPKNKIFYFFKGLLETYWDGKEVQDYIKKERNNLESS